MEKFASIIFFVNILMGIFVLYHAFTLPKTIVVNLRIIALVWATAISIAYQLLNYGWYLSEINGMIHVPADLNTSFTYWETSVGLAIFFVYILVYVSIKSGLYGFKPTHK